MEPERNIAALADPDAPLKHCHRAVEFSISEVHAAEAEMRRREAPWLTGRLRDPNGFLPSGGGLRELSTFGQTPREPGAGKDSGEARQPETLTSEIPSEGLDIPREVPRRLPVVAEVIPHEAKIEIRHNA